MHRFSNQKCFEWKPGEIAAWAKPLTQFVNPDYLPHATPGSATLRVDKFDDFELADWLPDVTSLSMDNVRLKDVALYRLSRLRQVRELTIKGCGDLTDYRLGRLRRFPLRRLEIAETPISHVGLFALDLRRLESLRIEYSVLDKATADELRRLAPLKELAVLRDDDVRERLNWRFLHSVPNVESLEISIDVGGRALDELPQLKKLRRLQLTAVRDVHLERIVTLRDIADLELAGDFRGDRLNLLADCGVKNLQISSLDLVGEAFASIAQLSGLECLSVRTSMLIGRPLESLIQCPDLKELSIDGISIADTDIVTILRIPNLKSLRLRNTWISEDVVQQIRSIHPDLKLDWKSGY